MVHNKEFASVGMVYCLGILVILVGLVTLTGPTSASVWHVTPDGTGDGTSWTSALGVVQSAINAATTGDEIWVAQGHYNQAITLKDGLSLYGGFTGTEASRDQRDSATNETILDASGLNRRVVDATNFNGNIIDGFTLTGGNAPHGGGVFFGDGSLILKNCTICGNRSQQYGGGVYCGGSDLMTLNDCLIIDNTAEFGGGIFIGYCSPSLNHCTIAANYAKASWSWGGEGGGVCCLVSNPMLTNCTISGNFIEGVCGLNLESAGLACNHSSPILVNCILWNMGLEIYCHGTSNPTVTNSCVQGGYPGVGNISAYPQFVDPVGGDWRLLDGSPAINRGVDVGLPYNGSAPDMGSRETPADYASSSPGVRNLHLFVDSTAAAGGDGSSWQSAFPTIQDALWICSVTDEIWVAGGRYNENISLLPGMTLCGGFVGNEAHRDQRDREASVTTLDAFGLQRRAVIVNGANGTIIDGFTITGGDSCSGAGVYYLNSPTGLMTNCTITGNSAVNDGNACRFENSNPILANCTIAGNTAGSGSALSCFESSPTLINCILWNDYLEVDVSNQVGNPSVTYCCVRQGYEGVGNISDDPLFVDPATGNYHLQTESPCIDAGNPHASFNDSCRPPGQGTERNDMGFTGGQGSCGDIPEITTLDPVGPDQNTSGNHNWQVYQ